jgi:hypothetical protein
LSIGKNTDLSIGKNYKTAVLILATDEHGRIHLGGHMIAWNTLSIMAENLPVHNPAVRKGTGRFHFLIDSF